MANRYFPTDARLPAGAAVGGYPVESSKSFYIFCGLVVTVVGAVGAAQLQQTGMWQASYYLNEHPVRWFVFRFGFSKLRKRSGICPISPLMCLGGSYHNHDGA